MYGAIGRKPEDPDGARQETRHDDGRGMTMDTAQHESDNAEDSVTNQGFPSRRSTPAGRTRPGCTTTSSAAGQLRGGPGRGQEILDLSPDVIMGARANRDFLQRAVRFLAESGVRQIIDIGTGIPTSPNTHEVAHAVSKDVRVAYIDNDPIVATHAGARLLGTGNTGFFLGDMRDPASVLRHPTIGELIDPDQPVALMLVSVLHFVSDEQDPRA